MLRYLPVRRIHARQVLDSRGNPTVEVEVTAGEGIVGIHGYTARAIVPPGRLPEDLRQWSSGMVKKENTLGSVWKKL